MTEIICYTINLSVLLLLLVPFSRLLPSNGYRYCVLTVLTVAMELFGRLSIFVTKFDKTRFPHTSTFMTLKNHNSMKEHAISLKF